MDKLSDKDIRTIRTKPWVKNEGINLDQKVIEDTVKDLQLTNCPVCKGPLSSKDNFDTDLKMFSSTTANETLPSFLIVESPHREILRDTGSLLVYKGLSVSI